MLKIFTFYCQYYLFTLNCILFLCLTTLLCRSEDANFYWDFTKQLYLCTKHLKQTMDKTTFKQEINDYTSRGGKFAFAFGDIHLPVIYHEALNMLGVKMPAHEVFVPIDYSRDLDDNLNVLMNKLIDKYPQLTGNK